MKCQRIEKQICFQEFKETSSYDFVHLNTDI